MSVSGDRHAPRVEGTLDVMGGGVRVRGFPHGRRGRSRARVRFTRPRPRTSRASPARVGGGAGASSRARPPTRGKAPRPSTCRRRARASPCAIPRGCAASSTPTCASSATSASSGSPGRSTCGRRVWTRRYDVASELLAASATALELQPRAGGGLRYDVKVHAPGTLKIDNNLATLQARADLHAAGHRPPPVVLGRAEIDRGRVYFQGNTYVIRRGTIDFANPQKIDPLFDIEAETRVRSYRVTLKVNGTLERVYPTLTSDPPSRTVADPEPAGRGRRERGGEPRRSPRTSAGAPGRPPAPPRSPRAASRRRWAWSGAPRSCFGLNRFSIDPSVVRGERHATPRARLTVGKRITPDLNVVYSVGPARHRGAPAVASSTRSPTASRCCSRAPSRRLRLRPAPAPVALMARAAPPAGGAAARARGRAGLPAGPAVVTVRIDADPAAVGPPRALRGDHARAEPLAAEPCGTWSSCSTRPASSRTWWSRRRPGGRRRGAGVPPGAGARS